MKRRSNDFFRTVQPLIGAAVGVGIFGLPYVFAQAGFVVGLGYLLVLGAVNTVVLLTFSDILMNTKGHPRFTGVVTRYLGAHWGWAATLLMFGATWGAMIAYVIIGGEFLHALFAPAAGGSVVVYQVIFFFVSAILLIGGLGLVSKLEAVFVFVLLALLLLIVTGSLPHLDAQNLLEIHPERWFTPFGVVLFAFSGLAAIPEMSQSLGKRKHKLRRIVIGGAAIIAAVYVVFAGVVVAVTGSQTSPEAILGLGAVVGSWVTMIGSLVGLIAVFTSFLILGVSIIDTMVYDFKRRFLVSWTAAVGVPLVVYALGAREFISVVSFTGSIFGGLVGLLAIYMYIKAKKDVCTPKGCLKIPNWVLVVCGLVFMAGVVLTLLGAA